VTTCAWAEGKKTKPVRIKNKTVIAFLVIADLLDTDAHDAATIGRIDSTAYPHLILLSADVSIEQKFSFVKIWKIFSN